MVCQWRSRRIYPSAFYLCVIALEQTANSRSRVGAGCCCVMVIHQSDGFVYRILSAVFQPLLGGMKTGSWKNKQGAGRRRHPYACGCFNMNNFRALEVNLKFWLWLFFSLKRGNSIAKNNLFDKKVRIFTLLFFTWHIIFKWYNIVRIMGHKCLHAE